MAPIAASSWSIPHLGGQSRQSGWLQRLSGLLTSYLAESFYLEVTGLKMAQIPGDEKYSCLTAELQCTWEMICFQARSQWVIVSLSSDGDILNTKPVPFSSAVCPWGRWQKPAIWRGGLGSFPGGSEHVHIDWRPRGNMELGEHHQLRGGGRQRCAGVKGTLGQI